MATLAWPWILRVANQPRQHKKILSTIPSQTNKKGHRSSSPMAHRRLVGASAAILVRIKRTLFWRLYRVGVMRESAWPQAVMAADLSRDCRTYHRHNLAPASTSLQSVAAGNYPRPWMTGLACGCIDSPASKLNTVRRTHHAQPSPVWRTEHARPPHNPSPRSRQRRRDFRPIQLPQPLFCGAGRHRPVARRLR